MRLRGPPKATLRPEPPLIMPQVTFRLIIGQSIRLDVEGKITVDQLRERMLPVYRELTDVPLHEMKLMFVKEEAKRGLFGRETVKVELGNGRRSLHDYGVGKRAGQRALIVVLPTVRQWGLKMLIGIKLDDVERCSQAASWHPSAIHWPVRREVRTVDIPVPPDYEEDEDTPLPSPEVVSYLTFGDFEAAGEDMPALPEDFGRLASGWVEGDTALHLAVRNRAEQVCQFLIDAGAPLSATNVHGCTPVDEAKKLRDNEAFATLLDRPPAANDLMWQVTPRWGSAPPSGTPRGGTPRGGTPRTAAAAPAPVAAPASPSRPASPAFPAHPSSGGARAKRSPSDKPKRPAPGSKPSPAALAAARAAAGIYDEDDEEDGAQAAEESPAPAPKPAPVRHTQNSNPPAPARRTNTMVLTPVKSKDSKAQENGETPKPKAAAKAKPSKKKAGGLWGDSGSSGEEGGGGSSWLTSPAPAPAPEDEEQESGEAAVEEAPAAVVAAAPKAPTPKAPKTLTEDEQEEAKQAAEAARAARLDREAVAKARQAKAQQARLDREAKKRARESAAVGGDEGEGGGEDTAAVESKKKQDEERKAAAAVKVKQEAEAEAAAKHLREQKEAREKAAAEATAAEQLRLSLASEEAEEEEERTVIAGEFYLGEYECMKKSQMRSGWQMDSGKCGVLSKTPLTVRPITF